MSRLKLYHQLRVMTPAGTVAHRNCSYSTRLDRPGPLRIFDSAGILRKIYATGRWYELFLDDEQAA